MDESFCKRVGPSDVAVLTGLLFPESAYKSFRARYHKLLHTVLPSEENTVEPVPTVHAVELFKDRPATDEQRLEFLNGLVDLVLELHIDIFRVGYWVTPEALRLFGSQSDLLGLCFVELLWSLTDELKQGPIWPVMEIDKSSPH